MSDLIERLHSLSRYEHDDASIGDEAAYEIRRLRAHIADLQENGERLKEVADAGLQEIKELRLNGPPMQRGTDGTGAPWMGTMRDVLNDYRDAATTEARLGDEARQEAKELRAQVEALKRATQLCDKHQPTGTRSMCVICSGEKLQAALSRIDYACDEPNEMQCSTYDVHMNEDAVVKRVEALRAANADLNNALMAEALSAEGLADTQAMLMTENKELRAQVEALLPDAERYRWLRDVAEAIDWEYIGWDTETAAETDAAIDAARG